MKLSAISFKDYSSLEQKYIKKKIAKLKPNKGFMFMLGFVLLQKKKLKSILMRKNIVIQPKIIKDVNQYDLKLVGFKRLGELESIIRKQ